MKIQLGQPRLRPRSLEPCHFFTSRRELYNGGIETPMRPNAILSAYFAVSCHAMSKFLVVPLPTAPRDQV